MPRIFDNIKVPLLQTLQGTLEKAYRADFCVGYFNLRGWRDLAPFVERWPGGVDGCCRLLIGMQGRPEDDLRRLYSLSKDPMDIDQGQIKPLIRQVTETFHQQLAFGAPSNPDEAGLHTLAHQLQAGKLVVKLFLRHPLHAKLYLLYRDDADVKITGYLGSSNLTFSGLQGQGELNVDVLDQPAAKELPDWYEARWNDQWCIDISQELVKVIEASWAREELLTPYEVYLKIAYHLSQDARAGLAEFKLPARFNDLLFDYQAAAVQIAAHHLNKRGGVMLGDVVGLGKTLMATALASIFQEDQALETLIICPKNLVDMWQSHVDEYRLIAHVLPLSRVIRELPAMRRYRLIVIDESHNLRNRDGQAYRAVQEYITTNESKCILLSATPYNMSFNDLSAQLSLFIDERRDLGIRPEAYLRQIGGEMTFAARHQVPVRSIKAFEQSEEIDDWRDLMRLYLVRRTRSFILDNYTETDQDSGRRYLTKYDGSRYYFPTRVPRTIQFSEVVDDQYRLLYSDDVVGWINALDLPRYGLGQYVDEQRVKTATADEKLLLKNLSRAGRRLTGFCRTNLFKRLESSGASFLQSIERHILRNYVYLYAIEHGLDLPIGTLDTVSLDPHEDDEDDQNEGEPVTIEAATAFANDAFANPYAVQAEALYKLYTTRYQSRFKWLSPAFFSVLLHKSLADDVGLLEGVLQYAGEWRAESDSKLHALIELLHKHRGEKVLVFSQFADTVRYLDDQLTGTFGSEIGAATGSSDDPTVMARRFSPRSNGGPHPQPLSRLTGEGRMGPEDELRVLVATDVLSEGQNLQDCAIVVNYDLPWAIIRLTQRAGRVDRIGQTAEHILCYSFLPAEGVEQIIRLRRRIRDRLKQNGEVVGSDERFFEDESLEQQVHDLYNEKAGILDAELDAEVDLASYAFQIWQNATRFDPALAKKVGELPNSVFSARRYFGSSEYPPGVLAYMRTADGTDSMAWVDGSRRSVTQSQLAILKAAECRPDTPPIARHPEHHDLVRKAVDLMTEAMQSTVGALGSARSSRARTYERLKRHYESLQRDAPLLIPPELARTLDDIYRYPLLASAVDKLNRQLRSGISDESLADLVIALRRDERLSLIVETGTQAEPMIVCSMGLYED